MVLRGANADKRGHSGGEAAGPRAHADRHGAATEQEPLHRASAGERGTGKDTGAKACLCRVLVLTLSSVPHPAVCPILSIPSCIQDHVHAVLNSLLTELANFIKSETFETIASSFNKTREELEKMDKRIPKAKHVTIIPCSDVRTVPQRDAPHPIAHIHKGLYLQNAP